MNLLIKTRDASGTYHARAYFGSLNADRAAISLGVSASCTAGPRSAARECSYKAASKLIFGDLRRSEDFAGKLAVNEIGTVTGIFLVKLSCKEAQP